MSPSSLFSTDLIQNIQWHVSVEGSKNSALTSGGYNTERSSTYGSALSLPFLPLTFFALRSAFRDDVVVFLRFLRAGCSSESLRSPSTKSAYSSAIVPVSSPLNVVIGFDFSRADLRVDMGVTIKI